VAVTALTPAGVTIVTANPERKRLRTGRTLGWVLIKRQPIRTTVQTGT
jgi:hypothetical protein